MSELISKSQNMRRDFADRAELIAYLKEEFSEAASGKVQAGNVVGGRAAAKALLEKIDPERYAKNRNYLDGNVTNLSAYIRHGVLSLVEVREAALSKVDSKKVSGKLVTELGWRDYFQRVYAEIGGGIWHDREPYKTGFEATEYADLLPEDIRQGSTGMVCIDAFSRDLVNTGYLHNHVRMWLAAYVVHWRRVKWQAGARWFLEHLLDGDPASNNLSWQWVASTFSHKPYFFNRQNLERYSKGRYCRECPLLGTCDLEGDYPELESTLFPRKPRAQLSPRPKPRRRTGQRNRKRHQ